MKKKVTAQNNCAYTFSIAYSLPCNTCRYYKPHRMAQDRMQQKQRFIINGSVLFYRC